MFNNINTIFLLTMAVVLSLTACKKVDVPAGAPFCIKNKVRKMEKAIVYSEYKAVLYMLKDSDLKDLANAIKK